jgi:hypothetical protein
MAEPVIVTTEMTLRQKGTETPIQGQLNLSRDQFLASERHLNTRDHCAGEFEAIVTDRGMPPLLRLDVQFRGVGRCRHFVEMPAESGRCAAISSK